MLKNTGIIRQVDHLGRLVIPKELRRMLDMQDGSDKFEIFISEQGDLVLRKYHPTCAFCNSLDDLVTLNDTLVCYRCIDKLTAIKEENLKFNIP